jgi:hypothetical protein
VVRCEFVPHRPNQTGGRRAYQSLATAPSKGMMRPAAMAGAINSSPNVTKSAVLYFPFAAFFSAFSFSVM